MGCGLAACMAPARACRPPKAGGIGPRPDYRFRPPGPEPATVRAPARLAVATSAATSRSSIASIASRFVDVLDDLDALDGSDTWVTRLRAWSGITGWRFESSSAHRESPAYAGLSSLWRAFVATRRRDDWGTLPSPVLFPISTRTGARPEAPQPRSMRRAWTPDGSPGANGLGRVRPRARSRRTSTTPRNGPPPAVADRSCVIAPAAAIRE